MNKARLYYEMAMHGINIEGMCKVLGISRSAFYRKCNGKTEFTLGEVKKIIEILKLDSPVDIFFSEKVS